MIADGCRARTAVLVVGTCLRPRAFKLEHFKTTNRSQRLHKIEIVRPRTAPELIQRDCKVLLLDRTHRLHCIKEESSTSDINMYIECFAVKDNLLGTNISLLYRTC